MTPTSSPTAEHRPQRASARKAAERMAEWRQITGPPGGCRDVDGRRLFTIYRHYVIARLGLNTCCIIFSCVTCMREHVA